jgi:hypothetical protein
MSNEIIIELDGKKAIVFGILIVTLVIVSSSYIFALFAFDAPSSDYPLRVDNVETLNNADNATKTAYNVGETVRINVTVEKALKYVNIPWSYDYFDFVGDTTCRVIVSVLDGSSTPVFLDDNWITISVGGVETLFFDYTISSGSSLGGYNVNVMLWTDWLKSGKALSAKIGEVNFNVT